MKTCTEDLRRAGKAYPRTCPECGLGPCKKHPKAENSPATAKPYITTPWKHDHLANEPTATLVDELLYRLRKEPRSYEICPNDFDNLRHEIFSAGY